MITTQMQIAISQAKSSLIGATGETRELLKIAMKETYRHWLCTNEDEQFRSAVGAVMLHYGAGSEEFARLEHEMLKIQQVSAMLTAAQAGLSVSIPEPLDEDEEPLGLLGLWHEVKRSFEGDSVN